MDDDSPELDFGALTEQAHKLGIHYTGSDPVELDGLISMARAQRGRTHPVPCFGLSFEATAPECRICQLRNPCADQDKKPRVELAAVPLQPIPCGSCGKGMLEVVATDPDTSQVRDYLCSQQGCQNSVAVQCGWETVGGKVVRDIVLGEPAEPAPKPAKAKLRVVKDEPAPEAPPVTAPVAAALTAAPEAGPKRVVVKRKAAVEKPVAKAPATKAPAPAQPDAGAKGKLQFVLGDQVFDTLNAVVKSIVGYPDHKFFKTKTADLRAGTKLTREFKGKVYEVEVRA